MSLDTLFQQILLTEQQISEKTRQSQEGELPTIISFLISSQLLMTQCQLNYTTFRFQLTFAGIGGKNVTGCVCHEGHCCVSLFNVLSVKAAIARCQDRVKSLTAKSECLSKELDEQVNLLLSLPMCVRENLKAWSDTILLK